jgi:peptidoglycan/LPS O-acetylase OafA/YrhL
MKSKNIKYIPHLDHIRAYASILIVFYHGLQLLRHQWVYNETFLPKYWVSHRLMADNPFLSFILEGHTAVALFLVLSGFVFTIGTFKKQIIYSKFIKNRLLRTYPLFLLLLFVGIFSSPKNFNLLSFLQTIFAMANTNNAISVGSFSAMFWTIAVEWQFYLVFPFLIIILNKYGAKFLLGIILIFIIMRVLSYLEGSIIRDVSYWTIIGRMDQFLIGMISAVIIKKEIFYNFKQTTPVFFILSTLLIFYSLYWFNRHGGWPCTDWWKIFWPTIEGFLWAFFIITYLLVAKYIPRFISKILSGIGQVSYSIYLIHFLIIQIAIKHNFLFKAFPSDLVISALIYTTFVIVPITLIISFITYTYIEEPFLEMRSKYIK